MNKVVFVGCSAITGVGLDKNDLNKDCKDHPDLWVNLCHRGIKEFQQLELINLGESGSSNADIFLHAVEAVSKYPDLEYLICVWTNNSRHTFNIGFNAEFDQKVLFDYNTKQHTSYIQNICDRFISLQNMHWGIVDLLRYINILINLTKQRSIKLVNINGTCKWDDDYFKEIPDRIISGDYPEFMRDFILEAKTHTDEENYKLYKKAHRLYREAGGIQEHTWANLYNSFYFKNMIDKTYDNLHPGIKTNQKLFEILKNFVTNN